MYRSDVSRQMAGFQSSATSGKLTNVRNFREKPICAGSGVACYIDLAEPTIFLASLNGMPRDSQSPNSTAMLRGVLRLKFTKSVKIRAVKLKFTGQARTLLEGICRENSLMIQDLSKLNALEEVPGPSYGTPRGSVWRQNLERNHRSSDALSASTDAPCISVHNSKWLGSSFSLGRLKKPWSHSKQSQGSQKGVSLLEGTPQQCMYKTFHPGSYECGFEFPINNDCPETISLPQASVKWMLEAVIERNGALKPNLLGLKEVLVVRSASEDSFNPISISKKWEDQLFYELAISGKSFPIGSRIPIALKLTPLAKIRISELKVYITENTQYFNDNKRVLGNRVARKILLLQKVAGKPLAKVYGMSEVRVLAGGELSHDERSHARESALRCRERIARIQDTVPQPLPDPEENMLGELPLGEQYWGQTEIEIDVQLPTCQMMERNKSKQMVHDCTWKNSSVNHWIKIVMNVAYIDRMNGDDNKWCCSTISINSPVTILNCRSTQDNLTLPPYSKWEVTNQGQQYACGCPNAAPTATVTLETAASTRIQPQFKRLSGACLSDAVAQRPIHILRTPSYNPPASDAELPPPTLFSPPPRYDHIIGTPSHDGLADYFARMSEDEETVI